MPLCLDDLVRLIASVESASHEFWQDLFFSHIVASDDPHSDDLMYFVRKSPPSTPNGGKEATEDLLFVRRKKGKSLSLSKEEVEDVRWKETFYLNLVVQFKCFLTIAICKKSMAADGKQTMSAVSYVTKRVYASPNKTRMDKKGAEYSCSFPLIYFNVEDFEDAFSNVIINNEEYFCVELSVLVDQHDHVEELGKTEKLANHRRVVVFQGAVGWDALVEAFKKKANVAKESHVEYIMMRGPNGKGHAQVAVSISPPNNGNEKGAASSASTSSTPSTIGRRAGLMQGLFRLAQGAAAGTGTSTIEIDSLKCCLTFINVSWQSIINDVNLFLLKK